MLNMYTRTFRNCFTVRQKCITNFLAHPGQYKSVNSEVIVGKQALCVQHHSLTRCYSTPNRSEEINAEYNQKYQEKLDELLKDPDNLLHYNKLKLEVEVIRHSTEKVPDKFRPYDWLMLFSSKSRSQRRNYVEFLWKNQKKEENAMQKKEAMKQERSQTLRQTTDFRKYGLHNNTMFLRIYETTMMHFDNGRLMNAIMYEPSVVFDLGFEDYMTPPEAQNCAKQLALSFATNRAHVDPFNLYFCNTSKQSFMMQKVHQVIPTVYDIDFPLNITSKSYLDIFDKSKLVYLTPHTHNVLGKFDPCKVYIIGAMVDKSSPQPVSFMKAKAEGIQMAKFPLAEYLEWGSGSAKNLPLNQVISILLDLRHTNNWHKAFAHVPRRKLKVARETVLQKKLDHRTKMIAKLMNND